MVEFIQVNLASIIVVVSAIIGLLVLYKLGKKDTVKKIVLALVVQAEKTLGSGTGELKYAMVIDAIYNKLPFILRFLFNKKELDTFIEEAVSKMKELLSKGVTLTGYDDEKYISTLSDGTGSQK
jgi:hypothetical protein